MKSTYKLTIILLLAFSIICASCNTSGSQPEPFTVNHNSPQVPMGEIEVQFDTFLSIAGLRKQSVAVTYYPREDAVCLQYRMDFINYRQFWSRTGRQAFISALEQYNREFEERTLRRSGRTTRAYGVVQGFLIWQQFAFSVRARANMNVELGYGFKDRSPYFLINQRDAEFIDPSSQDNYRASPVIPMYLTRAQAAELAAFFDQALLSGLVSPDTNIPMSPDVYEEAETGSSPSSGANRDNY